MKRQYNKVKKYIEQNNKLDNKHYKLVCEIHAKLFNHKYTEPCTCSPKTIKNWWGQIKKHYDNQ